MTTSAIPPIAPPSPADRVAALQEAAFEKIKSEPPPKAPFDPLPALRPTIEDKIEIDRALIALRQL